MFSFLAFGTSKVSEEEKSKPDLAATLENLKENPGQKSLKNLEQKPPENSQQKLSENTEQKSSENTEQKSPENLEEGNSVEKTEEDLKEQMSEKEAVKDEPLNVESNEGKDKN